MPRSLVMLWWVWLWPSYRFPLPTQLNTLQKKRKQSTAWIKHCFRSTIYWVLTFFQGSNLTTSWWLLHFRPRFLQAKISQLENSHCFSAILNLWNMIKLCSEFANLLGARSPPLLSAHWLCSSLRWQRKSILWWTPLFAPTGKLHRKAQDVYAKSSSRD